MKKISKVTEEEIFANFARGVESGENLEKSANFGGIMKFLRNSCGAVRKLSHMILKMTFKLLKSHF